MLPLHTAILISEITRDGIFIRMNVISLLPVLLQ